MGSTPYKSFEQNANPDVQLMKLNANGQQQWVQTYGGSQTDLGVTACEMNDRYYITGNTWSYGNGSADVFVIKADRSGQQEWFKTYGGKHFDGPGDIVASDWDLDELIIGGLKANFDTNDKAIFLLTIDDTGNPQ